MKLQTKNEVVQNIMHDIENLKFVDYYIFPTKYNNYLDNINCKITEILIKHKNELEELSKEYIKLADKTAMWDKVGQTYYECKRRIK
jgi:hypothetical protein